MGRQKHDRKEGQHLTAVWRNGGFSASYDSFVVGSSAVLRMNFCAKNPPLRQAAKRCSEIRFAPFAASSRRLPPPDVLRRFANFAHQAVLHNAYAFEASRLQASALRKAAGTLCAMRGDSAVET